MKRFVFRILACAAIAALAACSGASQSPLPMSPVAQQNAAGDDNPLSPAMNPFAAMPGTVQHVCDQTPHPGFAHCDMLVMAGLHVDFDAEMHPNKSCLHHPGCYGPSDLQAAYNVVSDSASKGKGMTVAVVDAYGYPTATSDLATYRSFFKLPACGAGCYSIVNQEGAKGPLPKIGPPSDDWRPEEALDVDMVSALCPNCKIILVQVKSPSFSNLEAGVRAAAKLGAVVISNSYGGSEGGPATNSAYAIAGRTTLASAGDNGYGAQMPCSYASVICVGGTNLKPASTSRHWAEVVWDGLSGHDCSSGPCATGSGCSSVVAKPSWQTDTGCTWRSETDVSADADPASGVVISCTPCEPAGGSSPLLGGDGGTSASSPMMGAMVAIAGNATSFNASKLWAKGGTSAFNDVTHGTNASANTTGLCPSSYTYICVARVGYDGPTGWGTPNGTGGL